ncbi:hypothetical protein [Lactovum odontotermitis]
MSGIAYIDFRVTNDKVYFIEVGTMYGLTENSIVPMTSRSVGIDLINLLELDINQGLRREGRKEWIYTKELFT